jgi:dolichol kinase
VEGSSAFVVTAILVVLGVAAIYNTPSSFILAGIVASFIAAVAEAMSYGVNIDDNLTIPLSFGAAMWLLLIAIGGPEIGQLLQLK